MCLTSKKKLNLNIFPKTVYKVVIIRESKDSTSNKTILSFYKGFVYRIGKLYTVPKKEIIKGKEKPLLHTGYHYYNVGFHSYMSEVYAKSFMSAFTGVALVECRIPAFSWTIKGEEEDILSNRIKIVKILKQK